jgi:hypothetical protein
MGDHYLASQVTVELLTNVDIRGAGGILLAEK